MEGVQKAVVGDKEYDVPDGIEQVSPDGIFAVDFDLIELAPPDAYESEEFFNPRHLGHFDYEDNGTTRTFMGQGFDKESMKELMADIAANGLNYPFLTRWVYSPNRDENGEIIKDEHGEPVRSVKVKIYDAERRYRCIQRLIEGNEKVYSQVDNTIKSAKEVYARIPCRIKVMTDEEAMQRACAVSGTSVPWGDAALARLIKKEYDKGKSDAVICKMLNRTPQWIAETYELNNLDDLCFQYLLMNKINREVAKKLLKISDVAVRQQKCVQAYEDAVSIHEQKEKDVEAAVEKSEDKVELVKAEIAEAKLNNESVEAIAELETKLQETIEKTNKRKQNKAASARPMAKSKNLRNTGAGGQRPVTSAKVTKQLKLCRELIDKGDETYGPLLVIKAIAASLEALLKGEDVREAIKRAS